MQKAFLLTAMTAAALLAQPPQIVEEKQVHVIARPGGQGPGAETFTFMSAEASFETSRVKGVPFSGDFVTENAQTLADGNRIKSANTTSYARDGDGRTRREITFDAIGPFSGGAARRTIFIHDPVSKIDYILDPQEKTARKIILGAMAPAIASAPGKEASAAVFNHRIEGPAIASTAVMERMPLPPGIVMHGGAGAVVSQRIVTAGGAAAANNNFKNEPLGKRMVEGVEAEGTRTTFTIPAGQIGNDRALDTISERWYSNDLKTVVLTTRKDPRTGESSYKLTNLRRGEPSRQLFELPPDYKIVTEDIVGPNVIRMRTEKKEE